MRNIHGKNTGIPIILEIFSGFMLIGFLFTFLLPETKGKTLNKILQERESPAEQPTTNTSKIREFFQKFGIFFCRKKSPCNHNDLEMTSL